MSRSTGSAYRPTNPKRGPTNNACTMSVLRIGFKKSGCISQLTFHAREAIWQFLLTGVPLAVISLQSIRNLYPASAAVFAKLEIIKSLVMISLRYGEEQKVH